MKNSNGTIKTGGQARPEKSFFENDAWIDNKGVIGVDEVGRGALAGPLVVTAAILEPHACHPLLKDSKKLCEKERLEVFNWLQTRAQASTVFISEQTVDAINIWQSTLHGMQQATYLLLKKHRSIKHIVVDAMPMKLPPAIMPPNTIIHSYTQGEDLSPSIAAASIIAKVTRDRFMHQLERQAPGFSFGTHKGYGTKQHQDEITISGASPFHRHTFLTKLQARNKSKPENPTQRLFA